MKDAFDHFSASALAVPPGTPGRDAAPKNDSRNLAALDPRVPNSLLPLIWTLNFKSALRSLLANKLRTILAMLGMIIGVGAVIAMLAMGAGAQQQILARYQAMGTNTLVIRPAQRASGGVTSGTQQTLVVEDALALREIPGIAAVSPAVQGGVQLKYLHRNSKSDINGVAASHFAIHNFEVQEGRFFSEREGDGNARVIVLGPIPAHDLFGSDSASGKMIKVNGIDFKVVGVMKSKGTQGWTGPDDEAFVPYRTAMKILFGLTSLRQIDILVEQGRDLSGVSGEPAGAGIQGMRTGVVHQTPPPANSIAGLLRMRHHLPDVKADDFNVQNQADMIAAATETALVFRLLLGSIASISLLVGGIGIMNIMLVTVTERTREIGTRKAIGAKNRDILMQFLLESLLLSGLGGLIGAMGGIGLSAAIPAIPMFKGFVTIVEPFFVIVSFSFAVAIGIVFGVYPAWRASQMDPIEALRYD